MYFSGKKKIYVNGSGLFNHRSLVFFFFFFFTVSLSFVFSECCESCVVLCCVVLCCVVLCCLYLFLELGGVG